MGGLLLDAMPPPILCEVWLANRLLWFGGYELMSLRTKGALSLFAFGEFFRL